MWCFLSTTCEDTEREFVKLLMRNMLISSLNQLLKFLGSSQESSDLLCHEAPNTWDWTGAAVRTWKRNGTWKLLFKSHLLRVHPSTSAVAEAKISACVCVFIVFRLHDSKVSQSINQHSHWIPVTLMVSLSFMSIQFTAVFHQIPPHLVGVSPSHIDMSGFQRRQK